MVVVVMVIVVMMVVDGDDGGGHNGDGGDDGGGRSYGDSGAVVKRVFQHGKYTRPGYVEDFIFTGTNARCFCIFISLSPLLSFLAFLHTHTYVYTL